MIIYELAGMFDGESEFFPSKEKAIKRAKEYSDLAGMYVIRHDIGRLTKAAACRLASGHGFSIEQVEVWTGPS